MIAPVSELSSCDYINHLDINFAWKSLVASCVCVCVCVCVWLKFEHVFSTRSSPALKCSSPMQKCSSSAQNVLVASDKHDLQCDLCLEVSSRDYLITSNEHVRLQCEIIFGGG